MTQDQLLAVLRQLLSFAGGFAVARGWLTNEQLTAIAGLIPPVVAIWWVWRRSSPSGQIAAVAAMSASWRPSIPMDRSYRSTATVRGGA
ncbi:hypothetical protein [Methylocella sp. CPCC 101449]|uniref:Pam3-gp28 family putative phage holin n=1 Tax=Methylocella sp. CPCC 101449 TaxID=2987531 RepID=UPI0028903658|nr:hypothetical protein [Methylocella sp. CPCC 101449]MDT2024589.1 hypothetical protein [Methylocella sp. CPCC 101449]